ncbi:hypothetical protein IMZ48_36255 [Candidatus Bathyarchaeota archaeon]|nr:hypothetical protein [Candidatus Bathyarchaeota archaeon]
MCSLELALQRVEYDDDDFVVVSSIKDLAPSSASSIKASSASSSPASSASSIGFSGPIGINDTDDAPGSIITPPSNIVPTFHWQSGMSGINDFLVPSLHTAMMQVRRMLPDLRTSTFSTLIICDTPNTIV